MDNAGWVESGTGTITANAEISPDGYQNADTLNDTSTGAYYRIEQNLTVTSGQTTTAAVFVKIASSAISN